MIVKYKISNSSFAKFDTWFEKQNFTSVFVLTDENTANYCLTVFFSCSKFAKTFKHISIKTGEENKSISSCEAIWSTLLEHHADRHSLLINLGGGMVSDIGGFCASVFKRGITFVNMPTTLLSMVDASFGGKTAVNFSDYKNQIGLFSAPSFIFVYIPFLKSLPPEQLLSAWGEVIKYALIADPLLWKQIHKMETLNDQTIAKKLIENCIEIKSEIVKADPFEKNIRKKLNFGHTIGHALESLMLENKREEIMHGWAVAAGCVIESNLAYKSNLLSKDDLSIIQKLISKYFNKVSFTVDDIDQLIDKMRKDKKNESDKINFTLINKVGNAVINQYVPVNIIKQSLIEYIES